MKWHSNLHFLPTNIFYLLPPTCFLFFEVPYFDRGGGWSYLISRAFFIVYLIFLSWFLNPLKSCRNIKNAFQLFQAYFTILALYISLSSFSLELRYCFAWLFTFYDIPFCIVYISVSCEFIFSHFVCAPHFPFLRLSSWQWWETVSSQSQSQKAQCKVYTHCFAKCALPVCSVTSAAIERFCIHLYTGFLNPPYFFPSLTFSFLLLNIFFAIFPFFFFNFHILWCVSPYGDSRFSVSGCVCVCVWGGGRINSNKVVLSYWV